MVRRTTAANKNGAAPDDQQSASAPPPSAGHNGVNEEIFFDSLREIESMERAQKTATANVRTARKRAKDRGIVLADLDACRRMSKFTEGELGQQFNNIITYARWLRTPVYSTLNMFDQTSRSDAENEVDAFNRGKVAGKRGEPRDRNPWPLEVPMGQAWSRGHDEGQEELMGNFKKKPDAAEKQGDLGDAAAKA